MTTLLGTIRLAPDGLVNPVYALSKLKYDRSERAGQAGSWARTFRYRSANAVVVVVLADASLSDDAALDYLEMRPQQEGWSMKPFELVGEVERQMRAAALADLFKWIAAQPPVPHVPLEAIDREELY